MSTEYGAAKKTVLVTGATSGIGRAIALEFAKRHWRVIINGRRQDLLHELEVNIELNYQTQALKLPFDVTNREETKSAIESIPVAWSDIDLLVNNAGKALGLSEFQDGDFDDWDEMIDTNLKGLLYVSKLVAKGMIQRQEGHIINVGSVAGKEVYPRGNVYCATKHAVDAITNAMRIDLLPHHIKVSAVHPGMVETEFSLVRFKGDKAKAKVPYQGITPLQAEDVADAVWYMANVPEHVNINEMVVVPSDQANARDNRRQS